MGEVARRQAPADAPAGRNRGERLEHEAAPLEPRMRNAEPPRAPRAAAPPREVEVEHPRPPAAAGPAAEIALDRLEPAQHLGWLKRAFDQRHGIGEVAAGAAVGGVEDDWRGIEQAEVLVQPRDRRFDHLRRSAVASVRPVRADRDGVEVATSRQGYPFVLSGARSA